MKDQFRQKVYLAIFFLRRKQGGVLFKGATCMYTKAKKIFHFLRCVLNEGATFSAEITVVESKASDNWCLTPLSTIFQLYHGKVIRRN
jgi:hypothetical protein